MRTFQRCVAALTLAVFLIPSINVLAEDVATGTDISQSDTSTASEMPSLMTFSLMSNDIYAEYPIGVNSLLRGKLVIIDPGHGTGSGGGVSGFSEAASNLNLATMLKANLESCGAEVYLTRSSAPDVLNYTRMCQTNLRALEELRAKNLGMLARESDPQKRDQLSAKILQYESSISLMWKVSGNSALFDTYFNSPYDYSKTRVINPELKTIFEAENDPYISDNMLFVSIHSNAPGGNDTSASGSITYTVNNTYNAKYYSAYSNVARNQRAATLLSSNVAAAASWPDHGNRENQSFFMIREHNLPGALIEVCYHTNSSDRSKLQSEAWQKRIVMGLTRGVLAYFAEVNANPTLSPSLEYTHKLSSSTLKLDYGTISGIGTACTAAALLAQLAPAEGFTLTLTDKAGQSLTSEQIVGSGDMLMVSDAKGTLADAYYLYVPGDANGDGNASIVDLLMIQKHLLKLSTLSQAAYNGADVSKDGNVSIVDLLMLQKYLLKLLSELPK